MFCFSVANDHVGTIVFICNCVWQQLHILLDHIIMKFATNQPLYIKDCIFWIQRGLILGRVTNESFSIATVQESDVRGCYTISLIIRDDLDFVETW
mmetsp:Transcript_14700/g.24022  ORF Transcript_14700/g.24022 Transcript_14700/m.24022 type:complete len:96 (-) Transcript_14700:223-510(-)